MHFLILQAWRSSRNRAASCASIIPLLLSFCTIAHPYIITSSTRLSCGHGMAFTDSAWIAAQTHILERVPMYICNNCAAKRSLERNESGAHRRGTEEEKILRKAGRATTLLNIWLQFSLLVCESIIPWTADHILALYHKPPAGCCISRKCASIPSSNLPSASCPTEHSTNVGLKNPPSISAKHSPCLIALSSV